MTCSNARKMALCLTGANALVYGLNGIYNSLLPVYLSAHHSGVVKGNLLSIGCIVTLFAPVLLGKITDKARSKSLVLAVIVALSAVLFVAAALSSGVAYLAVIITLFSFVHAPFGTLVDTVTLEYTAEHGVNYGPIRTTATVGYGIFSFLMGIVATRSLAFGFAVYPIMAVFAILFLLRGPQVPGHAEKKEKLQVLSILRNRNILVLFLVHAVAYFSFFYYQNFYNEYVLDQLGLPMWVWGLNTFATIVVEIPYFFFFDRIMKRFSIRSILLVCMGVSVLRYILLPSVTTVAGILLTGALTGGFVTVVTYCATLYIQHHMPPQLIASSIGLLYSLSGGVGMLLANFGGGYLTEALGVRGTLLLCAGVCLLSIPTIFLLRAEPSKK